MQPLSPCNLFPRLSALLGHPFIIGTADGQKSLHIVMTDKEYLAFKQHVTLLTTQTFSNRPTRLRHKHYVLKSPNQSTCD